MYEWIIIYVPQKGQVNFEWVYLLESEELWRYLNLVSYETNRSSIWLCYKKLYMFYYKPMRR